MAIVSHAAIRARKTTMSKNDMTYTMLCLRDLSVRKKKDNLPSSHKLPCKHYDGLLQDSTRHGWHVSAGYRLGTGRREETGKEAKDKPRKLNYEMHRMRYPPDNKHGAEVLYVPLWENVCATLLMGKERSKSTHTASPWNELAPICFKIQ